MPNCASIIEAIVGGEAGFMVALCYAVVAKQAANRAKAIVVDQTRISSTVRSSPAFSSIKWSSTQLMRSPPWGIA